jgi:acetyl-CoA C-acetyltransferase
VPGVTLNRFCGSGLEAVNHAAAMVAAGYSRPRHRGGVESMSRVPDGLRRRRALGTRTFVLAYGIVPQGISADLLATLRGITRDDADAFAVRASAAPPPPGSAGAFTRAFSR